MPNLESHRDHRRDVLPAGLDLKTLTCLEIGALDDPIVERGHGRVIYVDHATRDELVAKYATTPSIDTARIVDTDVVWGDRPLVESVGRAAVDCIIASHVAEHIPDLVGWLIDLQAVLKSGGQLMLILPDKRMSYNCLRRETVMVEVLDAFVRQAKVPQTFQLLDCALGVVQSDAYRMHVEDMPADSFPHIHTIDTALTLARHALAYGEYVDIHCWSFTPRSFARLLIDLLRHDLIEYVCAGLTDTDPASNWEFFVKLQTGQSKAEAIASWQAIESAALDPIQGSAAAQRVLARSGPSKPTITDPVDEARPALELSGSRMERFKQWARLGMSVLKQA